MTDVDVQRSVGIVDALRRTQVAAELDRRLDLGRGLSDDAQRDLAVLQVEALADRDVGGQIAIRGADAFAVPATSSDGDDEARAALEADRGQRRRPAGRCAPSGREDPASMAV